MPTPKSIAVLPFTHRSDNDRYEYLGDSLAEELIEALSDIAELRVTSRISSFHFKDKNHSLQDIGKALQVATLLEGSVQVWQEQLRVRVRIVDVADDYSIWSARFEQPMTHFFALQDEISLAVAERLREHLGHLELTDPQLTNKAVQVSDYQRYLQARYHLLKMTKTDLETGLSMLKQLVVDTPDFAHAHLGLNLGYTLIGTLGHQSAATAFAEGYTYLEQALKLAPNLAECQLQMAWISLLQAWDFPATYKHLEQSLAIRPTVDYYQTMASALVAEGRTTAAHQYIDTALQLDPFSSITHHLKGFIFYTEQRHERALQFFTRSMELESHAAISIMYRGQALIALERYSEALEYFKQLAATAPDDLRYTSGLTLAYAAMKKVAESDAGVEALKAKLDTAEAEQALMFLILAHTIRQEHQLAMDYWAKGIAMHLPMMIYLPYEPLLRPLHIYAQYADFRQQILGDTITDINPRKYKKALIDPQELEQQVSKLEEHMRNNRPYLNPKLSLKKLAEQLELPANQLSQILNEGTQQNFSEFVNTYRLVCFKEKAVDPKLQHLTILGLAYESGFNSKTVFNTFFKKKMGITPSVYWKQRNTF